MTSSNAPSPAVLLGRRGRTARIEDGALVLRSRSETRRIPLAVIERVDLPAGLERELLVVLAGPAQGTEPVPSPSSYRVTGRNAHSTRAFAEEVRSALPVRKPPLSAGARRVTVEPRVSDWRWLRLALAGLVVAGFLTGPALLLSLPESDRPSAVPTDEAVALWVFSPFLLVAAVVAPIIGWESLRKWRALSERGLAVEAEKWDNSRDGDGDWRASYRFTTADGSTHSWEEAGWGEDRIDVTFDPHDPSVHTTGRIGSSLVGGLCAWVLAVACAGGGVWMLIRSGGEVLARAF
ncbi:hypothetical protein [Streptomyces sp. NPDC048603]|uniref:hypothetical protein n=1 Tax=Streptomyces sp. NPDC048603 TaxID=3365577 RepID=UPI00371EB10A